MKLLLDENLPKRLKEDFPDHFVITVREMGWNGIKNGELMTLMKKSNFDCFLTFDKNLLHQQNLSKYPFAVFILSAPINTYEMLKPLAGKVNKMMLDKAFLIGPNLIS
jgi:predicted nuclease of predicted toxin-antitoxin system